MYFSEPPTPRLKYHRWIFPNDDTASRLFEILIFSELGLVKNFSIFREFNIEISGWATNEDSKVTTLKVMKVKDIELDLEAKEITVFCEDCNKDICYKVDLNESIAQFVKAFWND